MTSDLEDQIQIKSKTLRINLEGSFLAILITLLITLLGSVSDLLDFQRFSDSERYPASSNPLRSTNQTLVDQGFFRFLPG